MVVIKHFLKKTKSCFRDFPLRWLLTTIQPCLVVIEKGSVDIWTKLLKKLLTGGQKLASRLRMGLDGELSVEGNYRQTLFALRIHTPDA